MTANFFFSIKDWQEEVIPYEHRDTDGKKFTGYFSNKFVSKKYLLKKKKLHLLNQEVDSKIMDNVYSVYNVTLNHLLNN